MPDATTTKHLVFSGHLLMLGFGSIGQGVLPLLLRHIDMPAENISILTADARGSAVAAGNWRRRGNSAADARELSRSVLDGAARRRAISCSTSRSMFPRSR